jgi:hypothetical protein
VLPPRAQVRSTKKTSSFLLITTISFPPQVFVIILVASIREHPFCHLNFIIRAIDYLHFGFLPPAWPSAALTVSVELTATLQPPENEVAAYQTVLVVPQLE